MKKFHLILICCLVIQYTVFSQPKNIEKYEVFELEIEGTKSGNPFIDIQLSAEFQYKNRSYFCEGFYDGEGKYKIRFMPDEEGAWIYTTTSNNKKLDGLTGEFTCLPAKPGNRGMVCVRDTFHFGYADDTPYYPVGTTCYAWVWQGDELVKQTLETLSETAFNKQHSDLIVKCFEIPHYANSSRCEPLRKLN